MQYHNAAPKGRLLTSEELQQRVAQHRRDDDHGIADAIQTIANMTARKEQER